jgi:hypothetical protein
VLTGVWWEILQFLFLRPITNCWRLCRDLSSSYSDFAALDRRDKLRLPMFQDYTAV